MAEDLELRCGPIPGLRRWLERHPHATSIGSIDDPWLEFRVASNWRRVARADEPADLYGLLELMDNNPLVCADSASVPTASGTLALIALGPLARGGAIAEPPTLSLSFEEADGQIERALASEGWTGGVVTHAEPMDLGGVLVATATAAVRTPENSDELATLYSEAYGRSLFVREAGPSQWSPDDVRGKPFALYRLQIQLDDPASLMSIRVMADSAGKCGGAQMVHMMNVMAGFEESLGLED